MFSVQENSDAFTVMLAGMDQPGNYPDQTITFQLSNKAIAVRNANKELFRATLTINNEGICKLKIGDEEYTNWQVRKKALEKCFFELL